MVDLADFAFIDARRKYEDQGDISFVVQLIRDRPEQIVKHQYLRDFLIDIVTSKSKPASKQKLRKQETIEKYANYSRYIAFYVGCGLPKADISAPMDAMRMVAEDERLKGKSLNSETLRKELLKKKDCKEFKSSLSRLYIESYFKHGLAISIAHKRKKPKTRAELLQMIEAYDALTEEESIAFQLLACDEYLVMQHIKYQMKERGEKFSKKEWERDRDKLVSQYRELLKEDK